MSEIDPDIPTPVLPVTAQEALQRSETRYHRLIARMSAVIFEVDLGGLVLEANEAFSQATGYALEELQGQTWWEFLFPGELREGAESLFRLIQSGDVSNYEIALLRKNGTRAIFEVNTANEYAGDGILERIVGFGVDISLRKAAEETLRERSRYSEARYRAIVEDQTELICRWLPDGTLTFANQAYCHFFGKSYEEIYRSNFLAMIPEEDRESIRAMISRYGPEKPEWHSEHRVLLPAGEVRWQQWSDRAIFDEEERLVEIQSVGRDITEQKLAEGALRESEERYRLVLESVKDYAIFTLDTEGFVTSWNPGAEKIKGYSAQEILGKHFSCFYTPEANAIQTPKKALAHAVSDGRYEEEGWRLRKDGSRFWASVIISPIYDGSGRLRGFTKVVRDLSRRKAAEEALKRQTEYTRLLQEIAVAANQATSIEGVVQFTLDQICAHTDWKVGHAWLREKYQGNPVSLKVWHLEDAERYEAFRKGSEKLRYAQGEGLPGLVLERKESLWVRNVADLPNYARQNLHTGDEIRMGVAFPVWAGKDVVGVLEFFNDEFDEPDEQLLEVMAHIGTTLGRVVERKRLETEVAELQSRLMDGREAERVHLARKLHDGPVQDLYGISFNMKAFRDGLPEGIDQKPVIELQENLHHVARTLRQITGELRPPTLAHFGLEKAIQSHAETFKETHPDLDVLLDLAPDGQALSEMVRLALFRIYQHAVDNVIRHSQAKQVLVRLGMEQEQVILEIHDNGAGFSVPSRWIDIARDGHLGLAGAYERAQAIGGQLFVQSEPGKGTTVRVTVPRRL